MSAPRPAALFALVAALALSSCKDDTSWRRNGNGTADAGADATGGTWSPPTGGYGQPGGFGGGADAASVLPVAGAGGTAPLGGGQGGDSPSPDADAGAGGEPPPPRPFDCALDLPPVATLGEPCDSGDACGPGGVCAGETLATRSCFQMCVPGQCEDTCAGARCRPVVGPEGEAVELAPGVPLGACAIAPPPTAAAFAACGPGIPCAAELDCVSLTGEATQQCLPRCAEAATPCEAGGICAAGADAADAVALHCVLACAIAEDCPEGTTCGPFLGANACLPAP